MKKVQVSLGERSYNIWIGPGLLSQAGQKIAKVVDGRKCALITDDKVGPVYAEEVSKSLKAAGFDVALIELPSGEKTKSLKWLGHCYDQLAQARLDRKSFLVALGGGVVGDLAGFVAASYLRGIDCIQIPTTLLAQVDSSVGGKVGINLKSGKNLVGAFHQPKTVLCDTDTLKTLPDRELRAGLAEVIKYGIIWDARFFSWIEKNTELLLKKDEKALTRAIGRSCAIKSEVVAEDEKETTGARALLNFGHTLGHGLEAISGYGQYLHGEAISIGQVAAARLSVQLVDMPQEHALRIYKLFQSMELPVEWNASRSQESKILKAMQLDKKNVSGEIRFVLSSCIGRASSGHPVSEATILNVIETLRS